MQRVSAALNSGTIINLYIDPALYLLLGPDSMTEELQGASAPEREGSTWIFLFGSLKISSNRTESSENCCVS